MKIKTAHILVSVGLCFTSGCSTVDWKGTGERWHKNKRIEECVQEHRDFCLDQASHGDEKRVAPQAELILEYII